MAFPNCGTIASGSYCDGQCQAGYSSSSRVYTFCAVGSLVYYGQCTGAGSGTGTGTGGNQFSRLVEHALRSYLAYADCTQVLATPQLPYTMLGIPNLNPLSCRRTGSVTVFVDKIGGVQWVTIAVSATDKVLGWLPEFVAVMDFLTDSQLKLSANPYVLQLLADAASIADDLDRGLPVRLTGHSIGGAVATLLAEKLRRMGFTIDEVVTFGAPKFMDTMSTALLQIVAQLRRVTLEGDPIPAFPPLRSYSHAGLELSLLGSPRGYREFAAINKPLANDAFWLAMGNLQDHPMASYIGRLAAFLITDDVLLAQALAAVGMVEQFLGIPTNTLTYSFQWNLIFQESPNPLLSRLCMESQLCEVMIPTTIAIQQWALDLSMRGKFPVQPPWRLGLVDINEVGLELLARASQTSPCVTFAVSLKGDSYFFGMLKDPIRGITVECSVSCDGFTLSVRLQTWDQPFGIPWLSLRRLLFRFRSTDLLSFAISGQAVLFGTINTVAAVFGPSTGLLGMSIGYPNPIPTVSLPAMTRALCSCELPGWADTLLRAAEFRGVQGQLLMNSQQDINVEGVILRPGLFFKVSAFSLFWDLLRGGAASVMVYVNTPRGWTLAVTLNQIRWFNGIVSLDPLELDVSMTTTAFYFRFKAKGSISLFGSGTIPISLDVEVGTSGIVWKAVTTLGLLPLSKEWTTGLIAPTDLPIGSPIDRSQAQAEVASQRQAWVQRRVRELTALVTDLWAKIWGMVTAATAAISVGFDAVKGLLGLGRKFQTLAVCPAPDLSASANGLAAVAAALDAAQGCSTLQARTCLQQVLRRTPLNGSRRVLQCLGQLPASDLPLQLTVSLSGTLNVSAMSDAEASQLIQYALWYWPEASMQRALRCLVADASSAELWDTAHALLAQWPQGANSSLEDVQQKFLAAMGRKGLDSNNRPRALQAFNVLLTLGDCGANQTVEDYQRCIAGDGLACPLYFFGTWRRGQCLSTAAVAQQVLRGLAPGLGTAAAGKARGMQPLGLSDSLADAVAAACGAVCEQRLSPIRAAIDRVSRLQSLRDSLATSLPSLTVDTIAVADGTVRAMAGMAAVALQVTGTFDGKAFDQRIQVNPADPISKWMEALWNNAADNLYSRAPVSAADKWQTTAATTTGPAPVCQSGSVLRPPSLAPGSDEAALWAYWNATYGASQRSATAPTDDEILARYHSPMFLNNSWRLCDPICGTCRDIGYRSVGPATNATVYRTTIPDFVPPGYNGTPALPDFAPVVFPAIDNAFTTAPSINVSQASVVVPVYPVDQSGSACVEPREPPVPCDRCGAVRWPRDCPPATPAGVLGCMVDVASQSNTLLDVRALTVKTLLDATVSVSLWVATDWQPLGSIRVSAAGAAAPLAFPTTLPLSPNGTLRLRVMADRPGALRASPTYAVPADTFANATATVAVVATWTSASVQLAYPKFCHLSVEVCRRCSAAETARGDDSNVVVIAAAAAGAGGGAVLLALAGAALCLRRGAKGQPPAAIEPAVDDGPAEGKYGAPAPPAEGPPRRKMWKIDVAEQNEADGADGSPQPKHRPVA
eukprot:EG_transcript_212